MVSGIGCSTVLRVSPVKTCFKYVCVHTNLAIGTGSALCWELRLCCSRNEQLFDQKQHGVSHGTAAAEVEQPGDVRDALKGPCGQR